MSQHLKDPLKDLVSEVPRHVVRPDLAHTAWAAGRRRRRTRRAALTAAAAVALVVLGGALPGGPLDRQHRAPVAEAEAAGAVDGYPQRIGRQWGGVRDLPDAPGPVAAVLHAGWDEEWAWEAVSADGRRWRVPAEAPGADVHVTVSNTGRYLGYLRDYAGPYVLHDLVTGERTEFDDVSGPAGVTTRPFLTYGQNPSFWSPDDTRVLISGSSARKPYRGRALLLGVDGSLDVVGGYRGFLAGWVDEDRVLRLEEETDRQDRTTSVTAVTMRPDGSVLDRTTLDLPRRLDLGLHQWSGNVSPDGTRLTLVQQGLALEGHVLLFDLASGRLVANVTVPDLDAYCPTTWAGSTPVVPISTGEETADTALVIADESQARFLVTQPALKTSCLVLAARAASGDPHGRLGPTAHDWAWWWREILVGGAAAAGLITLLVVRRRRRT